MFSWEIHEFLKAASLKNTSLCVIVKDRFKLLKKFNQNLSNCVLQTKNSFMLNKKVCFCFNLIISAPYIVTEILKCVILTFILFSEMIFSEGTRWENFLKSFFCW